MSIIVGFVDSSTGRAALKAAIREAGFRDQKLFIANSHRSGPLVDKAAADPEILDAAVGEATAAGVEVEVVPLTHDDDVAEGLLEASKRLGAELIVIGLRRRSQVGKFIMGSLAQRILLQSDVPVLAVKPD